MASVRGKKKEALEEERRSRARLATARRGEASSGASWGMAPGRACGSLAGLSFAQLPLFITTAGRHNIDKGLRCLAAEILCDASQVSRLRHTHTLTHRERERERGSAHHRALPRRTITLLAVGYFAATRVNGFLANVSNPNEPSRYYVGESKFTAPPPCLLIYQTRD